MYFILHSFKLFKMFVYYLLGYVIFTYICRNIMTCPCCQHSGITTRWRWRRTHVTEKLCWVNRFVWGGHYGSQTFTYAFLPVTSLSSRPTPVELGVEPGASKVSKKAINLLTDKAISFASATPSHILQEPRLIQLDTTWSGVLREQKLNPLRSWEGIVVVQFQTRYIVRKLTRRQPK